MCGRPATSGGNRIGNPSVKTVRGWGWGRGRGVGTEPGKENGRGEGGGCGGGGGGGEGIGCGESTAPNLTTKRVSAGIQPG